MSLGRALKSLFSWLAVLVLLASAINFLWTKRLEAMYGGSALEGYVRDGHYYVMQQNTFSEVSRAVWENLRLHEQLLSPSFALAVLCWMYVLLSVVFPLLMGLRRGEAVAERVRAVEASGALIADANCAGRVAGVNFRIPFAIGVEVYPAGMTLRVMFEQKVAILKEELSSVRLPKGRFDRVVEIDYRSADIQGPLRLALPQNSYFSQAFAQYMNSAGKRVM